MSVTKILYNSETSYILCVSLFLLILYELSCKKMVGYVCSAQMLLNISETLKEK